MKSKSLFVTVAIAASLTLGGCDQVKKLLGGKPEGQVVATVDGTEITALELRQEMGNFASRDPKIMKAAQQRALQGLILRKLLVRQAKQQKLDKQSEYVLQVHRGEENLLAQMYQRKVAASVAVPSRSEAENYIAANPSKFGERKILIVEQVLAGPNKIPIPQFQAAKTLEDVKALFVTNEVPFQQNVAALDSLSMDPRVLTQIQKLPAGEVFVLPQGGGYVFNRISDVRSVPFTGDSAIGYASNAVRNQRAQESVVRQIEVLRKGAEKKIVYNPAFKPPPESKAGAKPAAAAPAAPAPK